MWKHRLQHCKASLFSMSLPVKSTRSRCDCTEDSYRNSCQTLYLFKHIQHISELLNKAVHSKSFWSYCFSMMNARFYSPLYPILHSIFILSLWFYYVCCSLCYWIILHLVCLFDFCLCGTYRNLLVFMLKQTSRVWKSNNLTQYSWYYQIIFSTYLLIFIKFQCYNYLN